MKKISITLLLLLLLSLALQAENSYPTIANYWLQAAPPNASAMAAYGELTNNTTNDIILVDAYSPAFNMTMIHQTKIVAGVAKMIHQDQLVIKAQEKLIFKPGGLHIMLMQPKFSIDLNDSIKINLIYTQGDARKVQEIWFPVEKR